MTVLSMSAAWMAPTTVSIAFAWPAAVRIRACRSPSARRTAACLRSEEHTSELQSHSDLPSFPTRRSSDLGVDGADARLDRLRLAGRRQDPGLPVTVGAQDSRLL